MLTSKDVVVSWEVPSFKAVKKKFQLLAVRPIHRPPFSLTLPTQLPLSHSTAPAGGLFRTSATVDFGTQLIAESAIRFIVVFIATHQLAVSYAHFVMPHVCTVKVQCFHSSRWIIRSNNGMDTYPNKINSHSVDSFSAGFQCSITNFLMHDIHSTLSTWG